LASVLRPAVINDLHHLRLSAGRREKRRGKKALGQGYIVNLA
jgi:hypothetical protein